MKTFKPIFFLIFFLLLFTTVKSQYYPRGERHYIHQQPRGTVIYHAPPPRPVYSPARPATRFVVPSVRFVHSQAIYNSTLNNYSGIGNIYYNNGYYHGQVYMGKANGVGTFYWKDGTFYHGNFTQGFQNGMGVLVSIRGYLSGCWNYGSYVGTCSNQNNYRDDYNNYTVRNLVTQVQNDQPANNQNNSYSTRDPDNYNVTRIDPNTQLGQSILGSYQ